MKIGVVFPQTEFGSDPVAVREYAQMVEELGFTHVVAYDHVLGANPDRPGGWKGSYTYETPFLEPFVLFTYMAAVTEQLEFLTGILIVPQRQTALVAKQAATLDVLSGGRLRLGAGTGWNKVEYIALGENFHTRGRRLEEQVTLLRRLWTEPLVRFEGEWHTIPDAGINPLPLQQPIPIWFGGHAEAVLRRTAKMGDGWLPNYRSPDEARPSLDLLNALLEEAGRSGDSLGIEAKLAYGDGDPDRWTALIEAWRDEGATHLAIDTMKAGLAGPDEHMAALQAFARVLPTTEG